MVALTVSARTTHTRAAGKSRQGQGHSQRDWVYSSYPGGTAVCGIVKSSLWKGE